MDCGRFKFTLKNFSTRSMASSFTIIKLFSSFSMAENSNCFTIRRGYAAVSEVGGSMSNSKMQPKSEEEKVSNENNWWIPDPLTGFYKPLNINDIDAAELRAKLLPKKSNKPSSS
ncbi:indole-3-acetic acid-induced protein ARG2-like [Vigna radiata var. radiata]|uniref:Indole-3-acetic acid-induced protein ARG2-like n=1 Tax=Vigna radiata var. radiata TaxID=3916 RepID=A0A1S3TMQ1_VIGRR|nr:indole-3-acetic acid-induced protein ARG2-like [Vigna radiata var. radiata]